MSRISRILLAAMAILAIAAVPALAHGGGHHGDGDWHGQDHHGKKHRGNHRGVLKITGGTTTLDVDAGTLNALTGAGFGVTPAAPATATGASFTFPITKGRVHLNAGWWHRKIKAHIEHSGGITFTKGAVSVTASNPVIVVEKRNARVFATVGGGRLKLLKLTNIAVAGGKGTADATLAKPAAKALNAAFGVTLFTPGLAIGKLTVTPTS